MENKVIDIARYAYDNVLFYKDLYDKHNINLNESISLMEIPIIKKEDFIDNTEKMISSEYESRDLIKSFTSGTTGHQLTVYNTRTEQMKRAMILWNEREKNCPNIMREKKAMMNDARWSVDDNPLQKPVQIIGDMIYLNTVHLDKERFEQYFEALNSFQPKFIHCPPSAMYDFVCYMKKMGKKMLYKVKYIELAGEYVSTKVYEEIKKFFDDAMVINYYGSIEFFSIAHGCSNNRLHITGESVYVEILNRDDEGYGNVVVTSLINRAMPLVRYDIGDVGRINTALCDCGRTDTTIELKSGRVYDYFIDGDRKITGGFFEKCLLDYLDLINETENCIHFSIKQVEKDYLFFNLIVKNRLNDEQITQYLTEYINKYLKNPIRIKVNTKHNMLELNQRSKYKIYSFMK